MFLHYHDDLFVASKEFEGAIGGMRDPSKVTEAEDSDEEEYDEEDLEDDEDEEDEEDHEGFMSMLQNFIMNKLDLSGHGETEKVS